MDVVRLFGGGWFWSVLCCVSFSLSLSLSLPLGCCMPEFNAQRRSWKGVEEQPFLTPIYYHYHGFGVRACCGVPAGFLIPARFANAPTLPFLPNAVKDNPRRGWGKLSQTTATVRCPGEVLSVFFFFFVFVFGPASFAFFCSLFTLSLRVAVWNKFSGVNFCFLWSVVVLCFSVAVCLFFFVWRLTPETAQKTLFASGLLCWVHSLCLRLLIDVVLYLKNVFER